MGTLQPMRVVLGNRRQGVQPHIVFNRARYVSDELSSNPVLIGKRVRIDLDLQDRRCIKVYLAEDDTDLGIWVRLERH